MNNMYNNAAQAKRFLLSFLLFLLPLSTVSLLAQNCAPAPVSRVATNAKSTNTNIYDDIAFVMTNLLGRGTEGAWVLEAGSTFVENSDKTASFKGVIKQFGDYATPHRLQINLTFSGQTFTAPTGSPYNNTAVSATGWYYYTGLAGTLTGLDGLAGGVLNLNLNTMHAFQVGVGANQIPDEPLDFVQNGAAGWIEWTVAAQPTDINLQFTTYSALTNIADIALLLSGTPSVPMPVCTAAAGSVVISNVNLTLNNGTATISGAASANSTVPAGYQIGYILTKGANKSIVQTSTTPSFTVSDTGTYCIHVLVYNPATFNFSTIQVGTTTSISQVVATINAGCICASLNTTGNCVTVIKSAPPVDPCAGIISIRQINNTATNCGSGTPYVMYYNAEYYVAGNDLVFTEYTNGTATITGKVVKNGIGYVVNILYSGKTTVAPSLSPKLELCATAANTNNGAGWTYYPTMSGTIQTPSGICNVVRRGPSFQVGNFGNLQQSTFGASGWFTGCTTVTGDFNFNIGNTLACPVSTTPPVCVTPITPTGWMYLGSFNNSNYYKFVAADATYADAKLKIMSIGGRLPIIKTLAQNAFIQSKLAGGTAWIGLYRNGTGWIASDGTIPTYYNWAAGEPNNWGGNENAVQMHCDGFWNDIAATSTNWTIAEIPCIMSTNVCDNDTQAPTFLNVPANIALTTASTCAAANWTAPTATDNCSTPSVSSTYASGFCFPIGVTTVTYTAIDARGNTKTASFTVTVTSSAPVCNTNFDPTKCYKIVNKVSGKSLDVYGAAACNDTRVVQWTGHTGANQQWQFTNLGTGYFKIGSRNSNKVLACHQTANGSTVYQYDYYAGGYKDWKIECVAGGYFKITHRASGKVLDVENSSTADGAKVQIWGCGNNGNGTDNQLWKIVEVGCAAPTYRALNATVFEATATAEANRSRIEFLTNEGAQADYFTVKKANPTTGIFETLETVNNINTTSSDIQHHTTYDNSPVEGDNLYQVEVTLLGGDKKVSPIQIVSFKGLVEARIYPNPAVDMVQIDLSQYTGSDVTLFIHNQFGQTLRTIQVGIASKNAYEVDLSGIETGNYTVRIVAKGKRDLTKRLVITK